MPERKYRSAIDSNALFPLLEIREEFDANGNEIKAEALRYIRPKSTKVVLQTALPAYKNCINHSYVRIAITRGAHLPMTSKKKSKD